MTTKPYLSIEDVHMRFTGKAGSFLALQTINLAIEKGEYIALIGHSGCGKSTLLNIVAGLANLIDAPTLFSLGVARVSLGGSIARAALTLVERAGRELLESGTLGFLDGAMPYADLQRRFDH